MQISKSSLAFCVAMGIAVPLQLASAELPPMPVPAENPITEEKRILGKILFWEEQLSSDNTVACGTCHIMALAGADPRPAVHPGPDAIFDTDDDVAGSLGVVRSDSNDDYVPSPFGFAAQVTGRTAPPVVGSQWAPELFWDGRAGGTFLNPTTGEVSIADGGALENQIVGPPLSDVEMAHEVRDWSQITQKLENSVPLALATELPADVADALAGSVGYPELFEAAFADPVISAERIAFAIATYERTLVADQTPYDLGTMTPLQQAGHDFMRDHTVCMNCHTPPLFTDNQFYNIGLRPSEEDLGRLEVSGNEADRGAFKTPTLRNVALRPELMHVGWVTDTKDAIDFYNANTQETRHVQFTADQSPIPPGGGSYANINMPVQFQANVLDFLDNALTDPRVAGEQFPFDRPTLFSERVTPNPVIFGAPAPGSGGIEPRMLAVSPPNLGNTGFKIGLHSGLGGALAYLLYVQLSPEPRVGVLGGVTLSGSGPGEGYETLHFPLPGDEQYAGLELYLRWVVVDAGAESGLAWSEIARVTLF